MGSHGATSIPAIILGTPEYTLRQTGMAMGRPGDLSGLRAEKFDPRPGGQCVTWADVWHRPRGMRRVLK